LPYPSEKYESQLGWLFPTYYGKMKNVWNNHQPDTLLINGSVIKQLYKHISMISISRNGSLSSWHDSYPNKNHIPLSYLMLYLMLWFMIFYHYINILWVAEILQHIGCLPPINWCRISQLSTVIATGFPKCWYPYYSYHPF
jgi:hypothetical protein